VKHYFHLKWIVWYIFRIYPELRKIGRNLVLSFLVLREAGSPLKTCEDDNIRDWKEDGIRGHLNLLRSNVPWICLSGYILEHLTK
jgi:hypothetical protein